MQQEKRRRVLRASLSIKNGEPIYGCRAIKSRVFHETFLSKQVDTELLQTGAPLSTKSSDSDAWCSDLRQTMFWKYRANHAF